MSERASQSTPPGKVWFVGAGPGAADLLTVRALRVMSQADVVLHDALITDELLDWAPGARFIDVGKRCEGRASTQTDINTALLECAASYRQVVRLKGGDPTVFGRLDEEIDALDVAGIEWEIVPGITAASAAAAAAGHSLTRRGVARRVDIVTPRLGRGEDPAESDDWAEGLNPQGTAVLYMAGRMSAQCSQTLMERGFPADTPVVAVRAASWPDQSVECSTLGQLASAGLMTDERPVVLLIGRALASRAACQSALQSADQALRSRIGQCTLSTARVEVIA